MSYGVKWAPVALRDLEEMLDYIASQDSPNAAERVASKIGARVRSLRTLPRRCRIVPELKQVGVQEYRELVIPPYRVFFRITRRNVGIVGVLDGRRDLAEILISRLLGQ